jgi:hypothetical protein
MTKEYKQAALPCIVCGEDLHGLDHRQNHPNNGLEFTATGHYGTRVFDPMNGDRLAINVCDPCMDIAIERDMVGHYVGNKRSTEGYSRYKKRKLPDG